MLILEEKQKHDAIVRGFRAAAKPRQPTHQPSRLRRKLKNAVQRVFQNAES